MMCAAGAAATCTHTVSDDMCGVPTPNEKDDLTSESTCTAIEAIAMSENKKHVSPPSVDCTCTGPPAFSANVFAIRSWFFLGFDRRRFCTAEQPACVLPELDGTGACSGGVPTALIR